MLKRPSETLQAIKEQEIDCEFTEESIAKIEQVLIELQEHPLNIFSSAEKFGSLPNHDPRVWESIMEEPCYTEFLYQAFKEGNYLTRNSLMNDFNNFIARGLEATKQLDNSSITSPGEMLKAFLQTLDQDFTRKLIKATLTENERYVYQCEKLIDSLESAYKSVKNVITESDVLQGNDAVILDHHIPKKMDPVD